MYLPATEFNFNVIECKNSSPVIYLMKKDPELPFGDFTISLLFRELHEYENQYITNDLEFDEESNPFIIEVNVPECKTDQLLQGNIKLKTGHSEPATL